MKKLMYLFGTMLIAVMTLASCSSFEPELPCTTVNQREEITLKRIQEYNEVMMAQRPQTRGNNRIDSSTINHQLDVAAFFKNYPVGSERVEQAVKDYLNLFSTYPENVDDLLKITNDYIEIIESSNEFTDDEKSMIYAGLMVSIYSPQIWDGFK